jgi:hypothetical protein
MIRVLTSTDKMPEVTVEVNGDNYKGHGIMVFPKECNGVSIDLTRSDALQLADTIRHALK